MTKLFKKLFYKIRHRYIILIKIISILFILKTVLSLLNRKKNIGPNGLFKTKYFIAQTDTQN